MKAIKKLLPKRTRFSNKTDGGKVLIIGGGKGLWGAGILSALAATRSGAGYTHLMTDLSLFPWLKFPDFIIHPIKTTELKNKLDFAIGIGPGLGINEKSKKIIQYLLKHQFKKVVADADALSIIGLLNITKLPSDWILTPHEGELARLLKTSSNKIKNDREKYLKLAVKKFQCTILLKGKNTLIFSPKIKKIIEVNNGTSALSKAGTGDVLLGLITALIAQKVAAVDACYLGAYIHGQAAKDWEKEGNDHLGMRPVDIINLLPKIILKLRK
jgi:NAD(P)H-hydrate epimerase